jgi:putative transposase
MCRVLGVSRQGYYDWKKRPPSKRELENRALKAKIRIAHAQSRGTYGSPRITKELREDGEEVGKNRVARLMQEAGIVGKPPKPFTTTTDSDHDQPVADNLLDRNFTAEAPNQAWVTDITYIPTLEGWLYLDVILDLYSRKVVGWSADDHMRAELCLKALDQALATRQPQQGFLHHSDRGSQYASEVYQKRLLEVGAVVSMSRRGNCWDNAVAESFFGTLKTELGQRIWPTRQAALAAIREYIHHFYNPVRRHSANGYLAPNVFEQRAREASDLREVA